MPPHTTPPAAVRIAVNCDDGYGMQLAAMVRSALDHLHPDSRLELFVLDCGIRPETRERLARSWQDARLSVRYLPVPMNELAALPLREYYVPAIYAKLRIAELLPAEVERVIYLDADLLVLRDLTELWHQPPDGHPVAMLQEPWHPHLVSRVPRLRNTPWARENAVSRPIPNFEALGRSPDDPYFSTGGMVIEVRMWREEGLAERFRACLAEHADVGGWFEEDPLNVVLAGRIAELDPRWNRHIWLDHVVEPARLHYPPDVYRKLLHEFFVLQFNTRNKPWQAN